MIKNFDNITVKSKYSDNYYDSFQVNTARNEIKFVQRDARRNGQVARFFTISVNEHNDILIEAYSADSGRYEQFVRTQCLELALQLLEEAKSEARLINYINNSYATDNSYIDNNESNTKGTLKKVTDKLVSMFKPLKKATLELLFGKDCLYEDEVKKYKEMNNHQK